MKTNISLKKYLSVNALGFGFGGLLWGLVLYNELPDLEYPFHYMAILVMALFGGLTLVWPNWHFKNILKSIVAGILGWTVGIVVFPIINYFFFMYGVTLLGFLPFYFIDADILNRFLNLSPDIYIGHSWTVFFVLGMIIGFFYAVFLKIKIWSLIWRAGLGLGLASLISPVIGNLIGNYFDSLLLSYLITFSLIGIIFSKFLSWGIYYGGEKDKKIS